MMAMKRDGTMPTNAATVYTNRVFVPTKKLEKWIEKLDKTVVWPKPVDPVIYDVVREITEVLPKK